MSDYFKYCAHPDFFYHGGGIKPRDLFERLLDEEEERLRWGEIDSGIFETDIDKISISDFLKRRKLKEYAEELISEVERKTEERTGEAPTDIVFFYLPNSHEESAFSFTLCALTRVDNNGTTTVFAPLPEYLKLYTTTPIDCSKGGEN